MSLVVWASGRRGTLFGAEVVAVGDGGAVPDPVGHLGTTTPNSWHSCIETSRSPERSSSFGT
jgi:hypothetical protein